MSEEDDVITQAIVRYTLVKSEMDDMKAYLDAGRVHKDLPEHALEAVFVDAFRGWAAAVSQGTNDSRAMNDARAEYKIRGIEPPFHKVKFELVSVTEKVRALSERMTSEQREEIGGAIVDDYLKGTENPQ